MDKAGMINKILEEYEKGGNIISYLKKIDNRKQNSIEDIMISYDIQTGSYNGNYLQNPSQYKEYHAHLLEVLKQYWEEGFNICEAGVGEATSMGALIQRFPEHSNIFGFDISWSRIKCGRAFLNAAWENSGKPVNLFVGDLFHIPLKDASMDMVYTVHALEPNGGFEEVLLKELYRVAKRYLILFEPSYELANDAAKQRMIAHGYVTQLRSAAEKLGFNVIEHRMLASFLNPLNPTGVLVIKKEAGESPEGSFSREDPLCCPVSKKGLFKGDGCLFCKDSLLSYPVIDGIACLTLQNAVLTTKYATEFAYPALKAVKERERK